MAPLASVLNLQVHLILSCYLGTMRYDVLPTNDKRKYVRNVSKAFTHARACMMEDVGYYLMN